jgi:flagellar M-ring protein FliF
VTSASVNLVLPDQQLFADQQSQSRASVLLTTNGVALDPGAVRGIAQLIVGGVKGLSLSNVSITDNTGQLLWPTSDSLQNGPTANLKQAAQNRYNQDLGARLQALLNSTVGLGKGTVQVNADLNVDQTTKDALQYANKGIPLTKKTQTEKLAGSGSGSGGPAGSGSNIPTYSTGGGGGKNNYNNKTEDTAYGVSKVVSHTQVAPGTVNKLGVAVLVDKSVPPAAAAQLQSAINAAAGIDPKRGDTLTVTQVAFAKTATTAAPASSINPMAYAKYALLGIALAVFLFFMTRHLKRREDDTLMREPTWLREIEAPTSLKQLEQAAAMDFSLPDNAPMKKGLEELAARNPDRVAQQVRAWLNEE